jgi:sucrose phosphorylase
MENEKIAGLLNCIYGTAGKEIYSRLMEILGQFKTRAAAGRGVSVTERDCLLISYGDMIGPPEAAAEHGLQGESGLKRLGRFLKKRNDGAFTFLHLLPFHPYSSDDGFSVVDYREVDARFGSWKDIGELGAALKLVFDFVVNHGSVKSAWFRQFLAGKPPYDTWYISRPPGYDYSKVVRPRTHPLLSPFKKDDGSTVHVWTTFSADQADYDFTNPDVLLEFMRILLEYSAHGGKMIRLDAVAYLWKEDGTACIHHPKTHAVVKLFRAVIEHCALDMLILTETNVPHTENISYFGTEGDEANLVYNFALPPLVLHAAISGDAGPLCTWASGLSALPPGEYYLNFLASHDGVGLTPARGIIGEAAFAKTIEEARRRGALVSMKSTPAGPVPYELNCNWADMVSPVSLGSPAVQARAFLTTYAAALAMPGLPAVYFHSWTGARSWREGPEKLGHNRAINREKPSLDTLEKELDTAGSFRFLVYREFQRMLKWRQSEDCFNPGNPASVLPCGKGIFALIRGPDSRGRVVICIHNFGVEKAEIDLSTHGKDNAGKVDVEGRSFLWTAFGGGKEAREFTVRG